MAQYPRIMLSAGASGSGKTLITCALLQALRDRGLETAAFKCGPDYIDPMFHTQVIGIRSRNLDPFFTDEETTRWLFARSAAGPGGISVMEGVMGFYDGLAGISTQASSYDLARITRTPVVLIADTRGMSVSVVPYIKGFLEYRADSGIAGVILNRMSGALYPRVKGLIEEELPQVRVLGYVEMNEAYRLESRHLGLVLPEEVEDLREKLRLLAASLEKTVDIDALLSLAAAAPPSDVREPALPGADIEAPVRVAVARDEAFCFLYEDNLDLLRMLGAEPVFFSPLHDGALPEDVCGCLLPGGYPELYAKKLSGNTAMREAVRAAVAGGLPTMAECGGFMYLQESMEDMEGFAWPMAGAIPGRAYRTKRLGRFGYITLSEAETIDETCVAADDRKNLQRLLDGVGEIRGHEFHYFDSTDCGEALRARKPLSSRGWLCMQETPTLAAGFPHLYYWSNPRVPAAFLKACRGYAATLKADRTAEE